MDDEKFFRNIDESLENWLNKERLEPPNFGGEPGTSVPEVEPEDVRAVWEQGRDLPARYPGQQVATGGCVLESICKPNADIQAVAYRAGMLSLMTSFAAQQLEPWTKDGQLDDAIFRATAKARMEWMRVGIVRKGFPMDMDEFLRLWRWQIRSN